MRLLDPWLGKCPSCGSSNVEVFHDDTMGEEAVGCLATGCSGCFLSWLYIPWIMKRWKGRRCRACGWMWLK